MSYRVVELFIDANEQVVDRKVIPYPYHSRHEAVETIEGIIEAFNSSGYDPNAGYWWAKAENGDKFRFLLEATA